MALIVEDGTGLVDADSYASVVSSDAYWTSLNRADWSAYTLAAKEGKLREATQYLDSHYFPFIGDKLSPLQGLEFPRTIEGVPANIVKATRILAYLAASGLDLITPSNTTDNIQSIEQSLEGVGSTSTTYFNRSKFNSSLSVVDRLLEPYLFRNVVNAGFIGTLVRV